jgi:hypothetical protein
MPNITVPLPQEDLTFLLEYSATQGISAETLLARQAHNLRVHLQNQLHPEVVEASGIIAPEVNGEGAYREHAEKKHA